jgi:putative DNA methylase
LASTFILSSKAGKEAYVEPVFEGDSYRFIVRTGTPPEWAKTGTKLSRGANFRCLMSDSPIEPDYIKAEGIAGRMGTRLMAIVAEVKKGRIYIAPTKEQESVARMAEPTWKPETDLPVDPRNFWTLSYGLTKFGDLFTPRQLVALNTFSDLVTEAIQRCRHDAAESGMQDDSIGLDAGGVGALAYAEAVGVYLAFAVSKVSNIGSSIASWMNDRGAFRETFARQSIPMMWDFAEANSFADAGGSFETAIEKGSMAVGFFPKDGRGNARQADASTQLISSGKIVSTDPPYYDNIGYADLSDFFYVWLRKSMKPIFPGLYATLAVPKIEELIATPYRHGSKEQAEAFFLEGMGRAIHSLAEQAHPAFPVTIYYAFKQSETSDEEGTSSTGWETFLEAVVQAGFALTGTWPMRTEGAGRIIATGNNALASSIIMVCRKRALDASTISRREFIRELNAALPEALVEMTGGGVNSPVAPVDLSQAMIGPGMGIFSKYSAVLEADGRPMSVRTALQLINRFLAEDDFDHDTQFCLRWFEGYRWNEGKYGEADVLSRAKGTSVGSLHQAGVVESGGGDVRLLRWADLAKDWTPEKNNSTPIWEAMHQLIRALNQDGETAAGKLLAGMPMRAEPIRALAYRLYTLCERKGWAEDARSYNELIAAWSAIERAANESGQLFSQSEMF